MRYDCFNCDKGFEEAENGMCPYCHSTDFVDKEECEHPDLKNGVCLSCGKDI